MSIESWIQEFYPVEASKDHTDIEAIEHAIQKWSGFKQENLDKHELKFIHFKTGTNSCSLCLKYYDADCTECPLYMIDDMCPTPTSSYSKTIREDDATFMLEALKKALIYTKEIS